MDFTNQYIKHLEPQDKIYEVWEGSYPPTTHPVYSEGE
jgi:hypothetical protein